MGAAESTPVPTLDVLEADDQRALLRNLQLLAQRDPAQPGKFAKADWLEVHAAMPRRLAEALWCGLVMSAGASADAADRDASVLDLDAVVRAIVPLRTATAANAEAVQRAHLDACFPGDAGALAAVRWAADAIDIAFGEAAPWITSMVTAGAKAPKITASRALADAARLLADAACAAWLLDLRKIEPLPVLSEGVTKLLADPAHIRVLAAQLPAKQRRGWRLLFTTCRDGTSFTRFVAKSANRAPCLVVVRDKEGTLFGGFSAEPLKVAPKFGGAYGSFLFTLSPAATVFHASGASPNLVYLNHGMDMLPNGLAFGGSLDARFFGLWVHDDMESGRSDAPCSTYGDAPCLASSAAFRIDEIEVWAVEEDPPPPSEEEQAAERGENALTAAGILSSKHEETRNFLQVATGKGAHSASLAPLPGEEEQ